MYRKPASCKPSPSLNTQSTKQSVRKTNVKNDRLEERGKI